MVSIPHKPLVDFNVVFAAEFTEFVLKGERVVVGFLIVDVVDEVWQMGFADGEESVSALPGEVGRTAGLVFDPLAGLGFEDIDQLRPGKGWMEANRQMHVVIHPAHAVGVGFGVMHKGCHYREEFRAEIAVQMVFPVFGAENQMNQIEGQGLWHMGFMADG